MQYRQHIQRKLENLEAKLKHIEFHNGRGNRKEVNEVKVQCEELISDLKSAVEREPRTANELNKS